MMPTIKLVVIGSSGVGKTSLRGKVGVFIFSFFFHFKIRLIVWADNPMLIDDFCCDLGTFFF